MKVGQHSFFFLFSFQDIHKLVQAGCMPGSDAWLRYRMGCLKKKKFEYLAGNLALLLSNPYGCAKLFHILTSKLFHILTLILFFSVSGL